MISKLYKSRPSVSRIFTTISLRIFGNHVKPNINLLYSLHRIARLLVRIRPRYKDPTDNFNKVVSSAAADINASGYTKLPPFNSPSQLCLLQDKIDRLFSSDKYLVKSLQGSGLLRLKTCLTLLPELEEYISNRQVSGIIQEYFRGHFQIYSCDVYRTFPTSAKIPESSFSSLIWHFDNCPSDTLKIMIYLRDTHAKNGALTLVDKATSTMLRRKGFWDRHKCKPFESQLNDNAIVLEGEAGSTLLFSTHHCIHKATLPESGYRDVAVFLVQPSLKPNPPWNKMLRKQYSRNFGYCTNPFTNKPLRVADE